MDFNDCYWHDSIIKNIEIDRRDPGNSDTIKFEIDWYDKEGTEFLIFNDVYWASMDLNFGIIAPESILGATMLDKQDPDLLALYATWKGRLGNLDLNAYEIELNSTGGKIKIISKSVRLEEKP